MTGFALVHGAGDSGWAWHLVEAALRAHGHVSVAPDLPADDDALTLTDYRDAVLRAVAAVRPPPDGWVVVGHSYGAFTAPLVADRLDADALVLVAGMVPAPGERPDDWWEHVGYAEAAERAAAGHASSHRPVDDPVDDTIDDDLATFFHDVPRALAVEATGRGRAHPSPASGSAPWPLDAWPRARVTSVVCAEDRFLPPDLQRRLARERLGVVGVETASGHCPALSRPDALAAILEAAARPPG